MKTFNRICTVRLFLLTRKLELFPCSASNGCNLWIDVSLCAAHLCDLICVCFCALCVYENTHPKTYTSL